MLTTTRRRFLYSALAAGTGFPVPAVASFSALKAGSASGDTPGGRRTVVRTEDRALLESMTREEFCGRVVQVAGAALRP